MAGETTATTAKAAPFELQTGLFLVPFTLSYSTTQNELNDVMEAGYIPGNVTVYGFLVKSDDLDTNATPAVVHKVTLGSTDLVTGITVAQNGGQAVYACTPTTVSAKTLAKVTTTTAAATAAAGSFYLAAICQK